ncbi:MAG: arylesterase [Zoogloea sp.]|jgi:acyl-CoA thioesterase-1|uniref:arylesterase n=1 Tax=Zoogloea sp. TaxID=49181 RepID=UPI001B492CE9|nr:arylesterase [Zoogloea sp.]MBP8266921.1 arylesterase [Zoogloea sp.]HQA10264.1 arylesterase [Zoogloea sp.]HQE40316.1 arylesterase [Zoogloea sp.]
MSVAALFRLVLAGLLLASQSAFAGTVLIWGDSLSAGYGLRPPQAWPALLEQRIVDARLPHKVVNASISGETTAGGRSRLPAALQTYRPSLVVIELGANDGLRGLPVPAMIANLQAMIDASREAGARVLLIGMRMPPNYGPDYTSRFERAFQELAKTNKLRLVPFMMEGFADKPAYFQRDGIHPIADAQPLILDTVWRELKPLLR